MVSGFPKSHDVSKGIDKQAGALAHRGKGFNVAGQNSGLNQNRELRSDHPDYVPYSSVTDAACQWQGWGTALKPAHEKICFAQKPNVFADDYDIIGSQIADLESSLWSMLPAKTAERNFGLSPSEFGAVCASAQWNADERNNTRAALSEAMGTARFVLAITSSLNTVSSWKRTWAEGSRPENTSTIETVLSTTIDLRTLKFCLLKITPASIMQAHRSGLWSIAMLPNCGKGFRRSRKAVERNPRVTCSRECYRAVCSTFSGRGRWKLATRRSMPSPQAVFWKRPLPPTCCAGAPGRLMSMGAGLSITNRRKRRNAPHRATAA